MALGVHLASLSNKNDPCYTVTKTYSNSVTITVFNVTPSVTYYFRVYIRLSTGSSTAVSDVTHTKSGKSSYSFSVEGLTTNTDYTMNFGNASSSTGEGTEWWGLSTFYTATTNNPTISSTSVDEKNVELGWKNRTSSAINYAIVSNGYIKDFGYYSSGTTTRYSNLTFDYYDTTYPISLYTVATNGRASYTTTSITTGSRYENIEIEITDWYADGNIVYIDWEVIAGDLKNYTITASGYDKTEVSSTSGSEGSYTSQVPFNRYNETYTVVITATGPKGETSSDSVRITTGSLSKWYWNNTNSSTGWTESNALSGKGPFNTITSARWKKFVNFFNGLTEATKIAEIADYVHTVGWEDYEKLLASDFWALVVQSNSMFTDVGLNYYTPPSESNIQTGKKIYGYYITDLTTAYNKLVDYILSL